MTEGFAITAELVQPITDAISSGLTTLVPIGLGIMATFIGENEDCRCKIG